MSKANYEYVYMAYCTDHRQFHLWVDMDYIYPDTLHFLAENELTRSARIRSRMDRQRSILQETENDYSRT